MCTQIYINTMKVSSYKSAVTKWMSINKTSKVTKLKYSYEILLQRSDLK
jgi:hypothetical protein